MGCVLLALSALACQTRDADKCNQGFDVTRQAIKSNDFALAAQWREYAYKMCDAAGQDKDGLATLDKELSTAQATVKANAEAEAQRKAKNDALLKLFVSWAGDNRAAPEKASASPGVRHADRRGRSRRRRQDRKERLCTGTRTAGDNTLTVRYWEADTKLLAFLDQVPGARLVRRLRRDREQDLRRAGLERRQRQALPLRHLERRALRHQRRRQRGRQRRRLHLHPGLPRQRPADEANRRRLS